MTVTATAARATRAVRPARREATPLHRTHPTPTHPTPTRAVPPKPRKPVNEPGDTESHDHITRRQAGTGTDASRTAAIVVTAASEVLAGLRPVDTWPGGPVRPCSTHSPAGRGWPPGSWGTGRRRSARAFAACAPS